MGVENGRQSTPWGGEWRRHLRSDAEMDLVRAWMRRVECPTCKTAAGRACRTAGARPTNEHRARRDAVGPIPYAKWRKEGLIPEQRTYTIPAVLKESEKARLTFNGTIIETGTDSYCLASTRARAEDPAKAG